MAAQREWLETDYYAVLGVSKDASADEIKKAYRRLARENHPDARPDDPRAEQRFKEIGAAYRVLGDADTRREYDEIRRLGASGFGGGRGGFGNGFPGGGAGGAAGFEDLFEQLFQQQGGRGAGFGGGGGRRGRRAQRGRDLEAQVHLSFDDALAGVRTRLRVNTDGPCETCKGSRSRPGSQPAPCTQCGGSGQVSLDQGPFAIAQPCPRCGGEGRLVTDPCPTCSGTGRTTRPTELTVRIPAGVKDGAVIRVPGKGGAGTNGGRAGDLLVRIDVEPDPVFGRRGDDVTVEVPITFAEAALGTKLQVPTPSGGTKTIRIPAGTASGRTFRVRGEGAPTKGGGNGDLLVTVTLAVPEKLSRQQKQLVEQLAEMDDHSERERLLRRREQGTSA